MTTIYNILKVIVLLAIGMFLGITYTKNKDRINRTIKIAKEEWSKK